MRLISWLIVKVGLLAVILSISLSGFGMAQAHSAMLSDEAGIDHSAHVQMDHTDHYMTATSKDTAHEGHANCPMIACCYTGAVDTTAIPTLADAIDCQHLASARMQLHKTEPESAKKPPKHV